MDEFWAHGDKGVIVFEQEPPNTPFDRNATQKVIASLRRPNMGVKVCLNDKDIRWKKELENNFIAHQTGTYDVVTPVI